VAYGEHVRRFLVAEGVEAERIFVAPHATDSEVYGRAVPGGEVEGLRRHLDLPGRPVVLYLGRLERAKGVHLLLEAFLGAAAIADAVLLFVGGGSQRRALMERATEAGARDRVRFAPVIPREQAPAYHAMASVLVLPSITTPGFKEPWGLVVNEAFHQGTPTITSDAVGAAAGGLVEDQVTGLVVPEGNTVALRRALEQVLLDPELRRRLGRAARDRVAEWSNERMVQGFVDAVAAARRHRQRT
jgi:glycosyltransferase involved in cell wall biosynthesis